MVFCLFVEYPATGYVHVETFDSAFLRALMMITLSPQPVVMSTRDYPAA
jgi:hypothetical protein